MMPSRPSCRAPLLVIETACWNSAALLHLCSALRRHSRSSTILRSWTACNRRSKPKSTSHRKSTAIRSEQLAEDEVTLRRILGCLRRRPAAIGNRGRGLQGGAPRATRHGTKGVVVPVVGTRQWPCSALYARSNSSTCSTHKGVFVGIDDEHGARRYYMGRAKSHRSPQFRRKRPFGPKFFFACGALKKGFAQGTVPVCPKSSTLAVTITPVSPEWLVAAPGAPGDRFGLALLFTFLWEQQQQNR